MTSPSPPRISRAWRAVLVSGACLLIGLVNWAVEFGMVLEKFSDDPPPAVLALTGVDLLIGILLCLVIGPLRTAGRWHLLVVALGTLSSWAMPALLLAMLRLGTLRTPRIDVAAMALVVAGSLAMGVVTDRVSGPGVAYDPVVVLLECAVAFGFLMWGRARGTRAALMESLREQAATARRAQVAIERTRDTEVSLARAAERVALARDMHDSLSHQLSLIAMHAGAIAYRDDLPPERVREAALTLRDAAATANAELREVLSALREPDAGTDPLATGASVLQRVDRARAGGQDVTLTRHGERDLDRLPRATVVALERILGELLVNADKHAHGAPVAVTLLDQGDELVLRVHNPVVGPPGPGTGHGLVGVRERARLLGGTVGAGVQPGQDGTDHFEVEVRVPWM